jgi:hypothetical protein
MGATHGRSSSSRTSHLPRKSRWRRRATTLPSTMTMHWARTANTKVFFTAARNLVVSRMLA